MQVSCTLIGIVMSLLAVSSVALDKDISVALNTAIEIVSGKWKGLLGNLTGGARNASTYSDITGQCGMAGSGNEGRLACNRPSNVKILYNVKVASDGITLYYGRAPSTSVANGLMHTSLPSIESVYHRTTTTFNLRVRRSKAEFSPDLCSHYIDGTLHVMGHQTTDNVFHALNDNVLPLASQVALDLAMRSSLLLKPRYLLYVSSNSPNVAAHLAAQVPHIDLLGLLAPHELPVRASSRAPAGTLKFSVNDTFCFRRVVWGTGARLVYNHALTTLRSLSMDLLRDVANAAMALYNAPREFSPSRPDRKKVTLFSRDGGGRAMAGEEKIVEHLKALGYSVAVCCRHAAKEGKKTVLDAQLRYAYHSDVIVGIHGAGLANSVFSPRNVVLVELKSTYAYTADLFAVIASGRGGVLAHVDTRGFNRRGPGTMPIDEALVNRVAEAVQQGLAMVEARSRAKTQGGPPALKRLTDRRDFVFDVGSALQSVDDHILGPWEKEANAQIANSSMKQYWDALKLPAEPHHNSVG